MKQVADRRGFIKQSAAMTAGLAGFGMLPKFAAAASDTGVNIIGPKPGYSPQVGTMVSMLTWMQDAVVMPVKGMTKQDLDHLFDANANSIGALLLHLAATETYYQMNTFQGMKWDGWPDAVKQKWDPAMNLGDAGRKTIKGNDLDYYWTLCGRLARNLSRNFVSMTTPGSWQSTTPGPGDRQTTTASGFMFANTYRITLGRSIC